MTAKPMQYYEACNEVSFIQSINPHSPGHRFNWDPISFENYRVMQSNHARQSGHDEQADQMMMNSWAREVTFKR